MASRRLAISSLLCDDDERPQSRDSQLSSSPANTPLYAVGRPYASPVRSAFVPPPNINPYNNTSVRYEQRYDRTTFERSPSPPSPPPYVPSRSITPLPLSLQPPPLHRRTPSPPPVSQPTTPEPYSSTFSDRRYSADERVPNSATYRELGDFPRHGVVHSSYPTGSYPQYPPSPQSAAPIDIQENTRQRRAALQISSHSYSPPQQTISPAHARFSTSPQMTSTSFQTRVPATYEEFFRNSSVASRGRNISNGSPRRTSASVSPTLPRSGPPSGLDVLVQAATEERERIDVNRRLSGGEEQRPLLGYAQQQAHSPVMPRNDTRLQPVSPRHSPIFLPSHTHGQPAGTSDEQIHSRQHPTEDMHAFKRRRSSPERQPDSQSHRLVTPYQYARDILTTPGSSARDNAYANTPGKQPDESQSEGRLGETTRMHGHTVTDSHPGHGHTPLATPVADGPSSFSTPSVSANILYPEGHVLSSGGAQSVSGQASMNMPTVVPPGRRSPPRSRPKPKKPGSQALAALERGDNEPGHAQQPRLGGPDRLPNSVSRRSLERSEGAKPSRSGREVPSDSRSVHTERSEKADDVDAHDFFLSAFESPRRGSQAKSAPRLGSFTPAVDASSETMRQHGQGGPKVASKAAQYSSAPYIVKSSPLSDSAFDEDLSNLPSAAARDISFDDREETESLLGAGEGDADIEDELAYAIGEATSGDEDRGTFSEYDEQEIDPMEIDVEDELLSLVDGPPEPQSRQHYYASSSTSHLRDTSSYQHRHVSSVDHDRMSMPPPDVLNAFNAQANVGGKTPGTKGKAKTGKPMGISETGKPAKRSTSKAEASSDASKGKPAARSRPSKATTKDKAKAAKMQMDVSSPMSPAFPSMPTPQSASTTLFDEAFPTVTSSGRMVTKSKKVAAAASSAGQSSSLHKKKSTAATTSESRSRSHSVIPRASVDPEPQRDKVTKARDDDKTTSDVENDDRLYCICKTKYDWRKTMIGCDRCDDWYHVTCIKMPLKLLDLIDQFICPVCIAREPGLELRTTWKQRCHAGLMDPKPDSDDACYNPSRGAYSKYCSDECGVRHMRLKIEAWAGKGGDVASLWATVKEAKPREGAVVSEPGRRVPNAILAEIQSESSNEVGKEERPEVIPPATLVVDTKVKDDTSIQLLKDKIQIIVRQRELRKNEMETVLWRERLLRLASDRAEKVQQCGWDQRLCFGDEEVAEFGEGVLESYEENQANGHAVKSDAEDGTSDAEEQDVSGVWWCTGRKKCERHAGWQKLRMAEIALEREAKEDSLIRLTAREREIRSRIEDILQPQSQPSPIGDKHRLYHELLEKAKTNGTKKGRKKSSA